MTNKEEGNSQMLWGKLNCGYVNRHSRPYYSRRCKGKSSLTTIESLPDELVFDILLHLPAEDIYKGARLVCKKWNKMICNRKFVYAHLQNSTVGLLVSTFYVEHPHFVAMQQGRFEISKFSNKFGGIWASCNGLILQFGFNKRVSLSILNPVTQRHLTLPKFHTRWENHHYCHTGIAYAAASMVYKVVQTYHSHGQRCAILTVGVDNSWRHVDFEYLSDVAKHYVGGTPLTTDGFLHWARCEGTHVVTLNVETEIMTETPVPQGYQLRLKYYLSKGRSITFLIATIFIEFSWEFWNVIPETGEWTKMPNIDLEARRSEIEQLVVEWFGYLEEPSILMLKPVGWLNEEALVLHVSTTRVCVVYNVHTQEIRLFQLDYEFEFERFDVYRNSLVWLGGC